MTRPRGLTLIEVLAVVALVAIVAALAVPQWHRAVARERTAAAASAARDLLGGVQALAMHNPHPPDDPPSPPEVEPRYFFRLELAGRTLQTVREAFLVDLATNQATPRDPPEVLRRLPLPDGTTASTNPPGALSFDRYGRAEATRQLILEGAGRRFRLSLTAGQADIRVEEEWL